MDNNLLIEQNSGIKRKDSTVNQLLKIVHQIYQDINSGKELASFSWMYQRHSIKCGTRAFYSSYVSLESLVLSMIG